MLQTPFRQASGGSQDIAQDLALWCGPVSSELSRVVWRRPTATRIINEGVGGIGSSAFGSLASQLAPGIADKLIDAGRSGPAPRLAGDPAHVLLAGFSAAHGLINPLLKEPESLARVSALGAFDAYYGRSIKLGYQAACKRAVAGQMLLVATTSDSPDPRVGSAHEGWRTLLDTLPLQALPLSELEPLRLEPRLVEGAEAWHAGLFLYLHAPASKHIDHAKSFAPALVERLVVPYFAGLESPIAERRGSVLGLLALLVGMAYAFG